MVSVSSRGLERIAMLVSREAKRSRRVLLPGAPAKNENVAADVRSIGADICAIAGNVGAIASNGSRTAKPLIATQLPETLPQVEPIASEISEIRPKVSPRKPAAEKSRPAGKAAERGPASEASMEPARKAHAAAKTSVESAGDCRLKKPDVPPLMRVSPNSSQPGASCSHASTTSRHSASRWNTAPNPSSSVTRF